MSPAEKASTALLEQCLFGGEKTWTAAEVRPTSLAMVGTDVPRRAGGGGEVGYSLQDGLAHRTPLLAETSTVLATARTINKTSH